MPLVAAERGVLYKNPDCQCCDAYADYLRSHDYEIEIRAIRNFNRFRQANNIDHEYAGCHTLMIDDYIVEGHVPVAAIDRLLTERPDDIRGISLPGMPSGSPGMSGPKQGPFVIKEIPGTDGISEEFDRY